MRTIVSFRHPLLSFLVLLSILLVPARDSYGQNEPGTLLSAEEVGSVSSAVITLGLVALDAFDPDETIYDVTLYKITYHTVDVFGNPTIASGAMYVPLTGTDSLPIISYQHGTVLDRNKVPSRSSEDPSGLFYSAYGFVTTLPDYLGMGDNPGLHPYLHWESEATASLDLIRAGRQFLNDSLQIGDSQLFLTGYSQGGHATMALHKYIQVNNLKDEFDVVASAPMSGPYSLSYAQYDHIFNEDSTYNGSYYLPYIIASYQYVYGNLYQDYDEYYDPPYDSIFEAWETSGIFFDNYPIESFPKNPYEFMQDSVLDNVQSDPGHPLRVALRKNDLHNWAPLEPVMMVYCGMDETVAPANSTSTLDTMLMLGATDVEAVNVNQEGNHTTCAIPAYLYALDWFKGFLDSQPVNSPISSAEPEIRVFPNPVQAVLTVETSVPGSYGLEIRAVNGQLVYSYNLEGDLHRIDLSSFEKGVYFVTVRSNKAVTTRKIVKL